MIKQLSQYTLSTDPTVVAQRHFWETWQTRLTRLAEDELDNGPASVMKTHTSCYYRPLHLLKGHLDFRNPKRWTSVKFNDIYTAEKCWVYFSLWIASHKKNPFWVAADQLLIPWSQPYTYIDVYDHNRSGIMWHWPKKATVQNALSWHLLMWS